jgi:2Fe-2S ferredoxin
MGPDGVTITVEPASVVIEVLSGRPLMQAAQAVGIRWPNVCKGQAQCGVCAVEVLDGDLMSCPPSIRETQMLERLTQRPRHGGVMRLACQIMPGCDLTVHKLGVRAPQAPSE